MIAISKDIETRAAAFAAGVAAVQTARAQAGKRFAFMHAAAAADEPSASKPPDCDCTLAAEVALPTGAGEVCRVDEYLGPAGAGYVVHVEFDQDGKRCRLSQNVGPETWRNWGPDLIPTEPEEIDAKAQ